MIIHNYNPNYWEDLELKGSWVKISKTLPQKLKIKPESLGGTTLVYRSQGPDYIPQYPNICSV
jgi:hypothetical protein